jgi:protein-tyrosine phosphatase
VIDLHTHLLPGIDDGPSSIAGAVAMAHVAVEAGTQAIVCTPHVHRSYPDVTPQVIHRGVAELREALAEEDVPLEILSGAEISLERLPGLSDADLRALTLGRGDWLLLELPFHGWPLSLPQMLYDLEVRGFGVVLAHPERAESVQLSPDRLRDVVGRGALVQVTASSFTGDHGARARRAAVGLLRQGLVHFLASDAHGVTWRPPDLREGLAAAAHEGRLGEDDLAWSVEEGPRLVVEGGPVRPPRLTPARRLRAVVRPGSPGRSRPRRGSS